MTDSNTAKHTPGPWKYHTESHRNLVAGPDRLFVADVWTNDRLDAERMANARLIAAAPELLAALRVALSWVELDTPNGVQHPFPAWALRDNGEADAQWIADRVRAAIAKAEGR
jgi:hypothetical protein